MNSLHKITLSGNQIFCVI